MALWSITEDLHNERCMADNVPAMEPIFRFSNMLTDQSYTHGERVRGLAYNRHCYVSAK